MRRFSIQPLYAICATAVSVVVISGLAWAAKPNTATQRVIPEHGNVTLVPGAVEPMQAGSKVLFDITSSSLSDKGVLKGFDKVARCLNLTGQAGLSPGDIQVAVVLHGSATVCALGDAAYAEQTDAKTNPNLALMRELKSQGVELYVCGQSMSDKGYPIKGVDESVQVGVSAMTVLINKHAAGYAVLPIH